MKPAPDDWHVECKPFGTYGYFFYHEGSREIPFRWEMGGGDVLMSVGFDEPSKFDLRYPWAVERKREILDRVAQEIIRQHAPKCNAEIDEPGFCIYIKASPKPA